jgi:oxygen-dependent protoporphyrinogen oxidase
MMPIPNDHPAAKNRFLLDTKTSQLVKLPSSLPSLVTSRHPLVRDMLPSVLKEPFRRRRPAELRDESLDSFVTRRLGPGVAHMLSAMIHGIYAASSKDISVRSGMGILWDAESTWGSVLLGMIGGTKTAAEKADENKDWQAVGPLGEERKKWSLYGIRDGLGVITDGLYSRIRDQGVDVRFDQNITSIKPTATGVDIVTSAGTISTDHLISAIPPPSLDGLLFSPIPHLAHNPYTSVGVVSLVFPGKAQSYHPDGFGYLIPRSDATANPEGALGVVFDSTALPGIDDIGLDDKVTKLTVMMGGPYWSSYGVSQRPETAADLVEPALRHLRRALPALANVEPLVISPRLHIDSIPTYLPGHGARVKEMDAAVLDGPWKGKLSLVGNGFGGVGVNDCVWSAEGVTRALLDGKTATGLERWRNWT